jgi:hypothetical protein
MTAPTTRRSLGDEGNPLTEETAQAYGIETVFTGEAGPLKRAIVTEKLVHGALVLGCRLDRRTPYASGENCVQGTAESNSVVDVPPLFCGAWVPGYGNEFGAPTDREHGVKVDCGVNPRARDCGNRGRRNVEDDQGAG